MKVLIVRFSSIGDIVLTTPVIRCMKTQINAEVHYLTKPEYRNLLDQNPYIDKLWLLDKPMKELISDFKNEHFDYIIDLHKNIRSLKLAISLRTKRLTYHKATFEKLLMVYFKMNVLPKSHVADRYLKSIAKLGVTNDGKGLDYFIPKDTVNKISELNQPYFCAVIGATHFTKRLPVQNWIEFINRTQQTIVLIGGKSEMQDAKYIVENTGKNVINTVGETNLAESALIIQNAAKIISNDTGMLHIAAALKKPVISLWGGTLWQYGFWPYYPNGLDLNKNIEIKNLVCRPCSKFGRDDCPKKHFKCMKEIKIEI